MPTTKKPADAGETPKPARTHKPAAAAKPVEAVADPVTTTEATVDPISEPDGRKDRTLVIAAAFLAAVALFAAGFGIGRASGDDPTTIFGANGMPHMPGFIPFGDGNGRGGQPYPHGPGGGGVIIIPGPGYLPGPGYGPNGGDNSTPPGVTGQAFLGIAGVEAPAGGVLVNEVQPGSGAEAAGLMPGDRIVSVDGFRISGMDELSMLIASSQPGATIEIGVDRAGETLTLTATLGSR